MLPASSSGPVRTAHARSEYSMLTGRRTSVRNRTRMEPHALITQAMGAVDSVPDKTLRLLFAHLHHAGELEAANGILDELAKRNGETGPILDSRADVLEQDGSLAEARALRLCRCQNFPDALAWINLAQQTIAFGESPSSPDLGQIDRELARQPESDLALEMMRAEVAFARGRLDEAFTLANALFEASPRSSRPGLMLVRIALARSDRKTALRHLRDVSARFGPRSAQADVESINAQLTDHAERSEFAPILDTLRAESRTTATDRLVADLRELFERAEHEPVPDEVQPIEVVAEPEEIDDRVLAALQNTFGYDELRPGQAEVIANVLGGTDTLAIMPTGSGKSLTFQI